MAGNWAGDLIFLAAVCCTDTFLAVMDALLMQGNVLYPILILQS